ncbi:MAG: hypothetical protein KZQ76_08690 [Candidatus Thiodiazotropha sp. (ex Epidulcina cf. delphinae)]|nr:hypothetical protein [Candidatus Thiodiazotropha sp. (ex Epidulcina cf. delphinae)]
MYIEKFVINRDAMNWLEPTTAKTSKPARNRDRLQNHRYSVTEPDIATPALATLAEYERPWSGPARQRKG